MMDSKLSVGRRVDRRGFLKSALSGAAVLALRGEAEALATLTPVSPGRILDAHIHLFDTARAGGVPWPKKDDPILFKPALPNRYKAVTDGLGIAGAIAIEASPLPSDNDWVLKVAAANQIIVGVIGDLIPGEASYAAELERLRANPLFLGIRYGNLWDRNLLADLGKPGFVNGLSLLAKAGLVFESANPDLDLIKALQQVSTSVPELRIVVDHLPHAAIPTDAAERKQYWSTLQALAKNPNVFIKLSEVSVVVDGGLTRDASLYRSSLDPLWDLFGEDRVVFGSDWPNSDHVATYPETLSIVREYIAQKGTKATEKYFWSNSLAAYRWKARTPAQGH